MIIFNRKISIFLFFFFFCLSSSFAEIQVFPTRIIFSDKERSTTISIRNRSQHEESYTLRTVFFRMLSDGKLEMIELPLKEERSLHEYVRFSPRKVTLKPGEEQIVRLMLKNTAELESGDYRAHLRILPDDSPTGNKNSLEGKVSTELVAKVAVSISMFYYKGDVRPSASMTDFKVIQNKDKNGLYDFEVKLENRGKNFLIGSFEIYHQGKDGVEKKIGYLDGIFSYLPTRTLKYSFLIPENEDIKNGPIKLKFIGPEIIGFPLIAETQTKL